MPKRLLPLRPKTRIQRWRKFRRLTQEQLAERVDKTKGWVSQIEKGTIPYTQDTLEALADALGTDPASLLRSDPEEDKDLWAVWDEARPGERVQIIEVAKALVSAGRRPQRDN